MGAARAGFEERLAAQEGPALVAAEIESETRRGRDYVRVTITGAVDAADVAEAPYGRAGHLLPGRRRRCRRMGHGCRVG